MLLPQLLLSPKGRSSQVSARVPSQTASSNDRRLLYTAYSYARVAARGAASTRLRTRVSSVAAPVTVLLLQHCC